MNMSSLCGLSAAEKPPLETPLPPASPLKGETGETATYCSSILFRRGAQGVFKQLNSNPQTHATSNGVEQRPRRLLESGLRAQRPSVNPDG